MQGQTVSELQSLRGKKFGNNMILYSIMETAEVLDSILRMTTYLEMRKNFEQLYSDISSDTHINKDSFDSNFKKKHRESDWCEHK